MTGAGGRFSVEVGPESADPGFDGPSRLPLEHALALDSICAGLDPGDRAYVTTSDPSLLQGVVNRHGRLVVDEGLAEDVSVPNVVDLESTDAEVQADVDRALVLEPADVGTVEGTIEAADVDRHDCLVANPYSYNRVEDRSVKGWCSPWRVLLAYRDAGYETELTGYHGPRSIAASAVGRLWSALDRPDRRDRYTHRMRDVYCERSTPLALGSCLVHVAATRGSG